MDIPSLIARQRSYFQSGATLSLSNRQQALDRLHQSIRSHEYEIHAALAADLNKSSLEVYLCETGMTLSELSFIKKHLAGWMKPQHRPTPLAQFHAKSFVVSEPYGVVLIMSPWNYPFLLTMEPLIGAIAAGNCCIVKPSAYSPATSSIIKTILSECFPDEYVTVVEGGRQENQTLLEQVFDYIFFTGSPSVGREVMARATEHLTPVTLELGGKSPCIVDATAKLDLAAKRIVFGKLLNCGQTCVAPDYLLVHSSIKNRFLEYAAKWMTTMYGSDPLDNEGYVRMVNQKHFDRVMRLIDPSKVVYGGRGDPNTLKIQPTILDHVTLDDPVMQEEIFGPLLPVLTYDTTQQAVELIRHFPHPLALYLFSEDTKIQNDFIHHVPFGGGCINDTVIHLATSHMGFGGVGGSGMGCYHGRDSFDTFSHQKSIVKKSTWMDLPFRYAPYTPIKEKCIKFFLK